ncbi:MAG: hypothetical protein IJ434_03340 [Alistipes sp.]|nr:hypothetical protein [Alistipes sp.]
MKDNTSSPYGNSKFKIDFGLEFRLLLKNLSLEAAGVALALCLQRYKLKLENNKQRHCEEDFSPTWQSPMAEIS